MSTEKVKITIEISRQDFEVLEFAAKYYGFHTSYLGDFGDQRTVENMAAIYIDMAIKHTIESVTFKGQQFLRTER